MDAITASLIAAAIALSGTLLGAIIGVGGNVLVSHLQRKAEMKSLASAFYGEVGALLTIAERRGYLGQLKRLLDYVEQTQKKESFYFKITKNYFHVYESNVNKIGILPAPLPEKIVSFYTYVFAIMEDLEDFRGMKLETLTIEANLKQLKDFYNLFQETEESGKSVRGLIEKKGFVIKLKNK